MAYLGPTLIFPMKASLPLRLLRLQSTSPRIRTTLQKLHLMPGTPPSSSAQKKTTPKSTESISDWTNWFNQAAMNPPGPFDLSDVRPSGPRLSPARAVDLAGRFVPVKKEITSLSSRPMVQEQKEWDKESDSKWGVLLRELSDSAHKYQDFSRNKSPNLLLDMYAFSRRLANYHNLVRDKGPELSPEVTGVDVMLPLDQSFSSGKEQEEEFQKTLSCLNGLLANFLPARSSGTTSQGT